MEELNDEKIKIEEIKPDKSKRILTGDRPTGHLHIGHYFGSLKSRLKLQDQFETFIEVADVQALTDNFNNPDKVKQNVKQILMDELAIRNRPKQGNVFFTITNSGNSRINCFLLQFSNNSKTSEKSNSKNRNSSKKRNIW